MTWALPLMQLAFAAYQESQKDEEGGNKGEFKSPYPTETHDLLKDLTKGMKGGAPDITQNPQYQQGNEWLNALFNDPEFFKRFEAPMLRQFEEQTMPQLANRYAAMGTGGAFQGSAFRNQVAREGANLQEKIAAMRGNMQQQGVNQAMQSAQMPSTNYQNQLNSILGFQPNQMYQPPNSASGQILGPAMQSYLQNYGLGGSGPSPSSSPSTPQVPMANTDIVNSMNRAVPGVNAMTQ